MKSRRSKSTPSRPRRLPHLPSRHWQTSSLVDGGGYTISSIHVRRIAVVARPKFRDWLETSLVRFIARIRHWTTQPLRSTLKPKGVLVEHDGGTTARNIPITQGTDAQM